MMSGVDAFMAIYAALTPEEQEEVFARLCAQRLLAQDKAEPETDNKRTRSRCGQLSGR